jgi:hypothetical protein
VPRAREHAPNRQADASRKVVGLIESALHASPWVQRHGHDRIRAGEHGFARVDHHLCQRRCEGAAPVVLEGVDDLAQ